MAVTVPTVEDLDAVYTHLAELEAKLGGYALAGHTHAPAPPPDEPPPVDPPVEEPVEPPPVEEPPVDPLRGWELVYEQTRWPSLDGFAIWNGRDRPLPQGPRYREHTSIVDDPAGRFCRVETKQAPDGTWASGGFGLLTHARTYGRYELVTRLSASFGTRGVCLLWPDDKGVWPAAELDFVEISAQYPDRQLNTVSNHGLIDGKHDINRGTHAADYTTWRAAVVEWLPDSITVHVDGEQAYRTTDPSRVWNGPMWVGAQTALGNLYENQQRTPTALDVKSIRIWKPSAAT
jgi:hypothetical protein